MKKIVIHHGFHPEVERVYKGEFIMKVLFMRKEPNGEDLPVEKISSEPGLFYYLENGGWVKSLGGEKYLTDWTVEERWGRVEEVEYSEAGEIVSARDLGFMILEVSRNKGLL